jgi:CcmD family protein
VIAVTHLGYLIAGYSITFGAIGGYVAWLGIRQRAVRRAVADDGSRREPTGTSR